MTQPQRGRALWELCGGVLREGVPGCFVECGVWKGGSAAIMGMALQTQGENRELHLFDSFEGLPEPTEQDGSAAIAYSGGKASGALSPIGACQANVDEVRQMLTTTARIPESQLRFHVGWFEHTIPVDAKTLGPIAVLRLDGDWYSSTRICLEHLYPLLSPGGVLFLDDYLCWEGCRKATDEYRSTHGISAPITQVDTEACYWRKS
jgi:O-methyltransferase